MEPAAVPVPVPTNVLHSRQQSSQDTVLVAASGVVKMSPASVSTHHPSPRIGSSPSSSPSPSLSPDISLEGTVCDIIIIVSLIHDVMYLTVSNNNHKIVSTDELVEKMEDATSARESANTVSAPNERKEEDEICEIDSRQCFDDGRDHDSLTDMQQSCDEVDDSFPSNNIVSNASTASASVDTISNVALMVTELKATHPEKDLTVDTIEPLMEKEPHDSPSQSLDPQPSQPQPQQDDICNTKTDADAVSLESLYSRIYNALRPFPSYVMSYLFFLIVVVISVLLSPLIKSDTNKLDRFHNKGNIMLFNALLFSSITWTSLSTSLHVSPSSHLFLSLRVFL